MVLCGSVLPQDFPWEQLQGRFNDESTINEVGKSDIWPVLAQSLSWGYGASGTHGFGAVLVKDRFHAGGHGQYFDPKFVEKYWEPFIRRGEYQETEFEAKMPPTPWWMSVVGILPIRWAIVLLVIATFLLVGWQLRLSYTPQHTQGGPSLSHPQLAPVNENAPRVSLSPSRDKLVGAIAEWTKIPFVPFSKPIRLFYSYAPEDERLRHMLADHLSLLRRQNVIAEWHSRQIESGEESKGLIDKNLAEAHVILLLVSSEFLASDYCQDVETNLALKRQKRGDATVIPVIVRACDWEESPFGKLQALPTNGKPITSWTNRDEAFTDVAIGIRRVVEKMETQADEVMARWRVLQDAQQRIFAEFKEPDKQAKKPAEIRKGKDPRKSQELEEAFNKWEYYIRE